MLGDNNNNQKYEPNYYSRIRFKNQDESLLMGFTFWKGLLKIGISKFENTGYQANGYQQNKSNDVISLYLSPTKARMMGLYIRQIVESKNDITRGISTGSGENQGLFAIYRKNNKYFAVLAKVDNKGKYISYNEFEFKSEYHFGLSINNLESLEFAKDYMDTIELYQLSELLMDYARYANGAVGAMVHDSNRYEFAKLNDMVFKISNKVGASSKSSKGSSSDSYFNNNGGSDSTTTSYESDVDLASEFGLD